MPIHNAHQECTNHGCQVALVTVLRGGSLILRRLLEFLKICVPQMYTEYICGENQ